MARTKASAYPEKYYRGLSKRQTAKRQKEIARFGKMHWRDPKAYVGFETNKGVKTKRRSTYTIQWNTLFPDAKSLKERAQVTGVPLPILEQVYHRAEAAWRTGHRPGQTTHSWAYPRVSSFLLCGKTHYTADADLVRKARKTKKGRKWFQRCGSE
jgi:hypothetical protein